MSAGVLGGVPERLHEFGFRQVVEVFEMLATWLSGMFQMYLESFEEFDWF